MSYKKETMEYKCVLGNIAIQNLACNDIFLMKQRMAQMKSHVTLHDHNINWIDNVIGFASTGPDGRPINQLARSAFYN